MASPMSKRSCPVRQLSLQQELHGNKLRRNPTLTKQKSCDSGGHGGALNNNSNHLKLQINSTKFGRSLTPDLRQPRHRTPAPAPPTKPKPVRLAWSDKKPAAVSSGGEGELLDGGKVEVVATKCKEIPRPFTAKPKIEMDTKNTILYTKEELADRLKSAIKERQSRKQNLDIFLAHNVNNQTEVDYRRLKTTSLFQSDLSSLVQGTAVEVNHAKVLGFQNMPTSFVPYDDFMKVGNRSFSTATKVVSSDAVENVVLSNTNLCNTCDCDADVQNLEGTEENSSYFLMASSPCLHGKEEHEPNNILKFKEIFNIEKQRPFSVRVIDDRIDIFNDDEDNDSLLIESDNEDGDSLSSSVEIEEPSRVSIVGVQAQSREEVCPVDTKVPSKVPASERRNLFKNSGGRNRNMNATAKALDSVAAKRSRLVRMSSAPSANVNKTSLKRQTTIANDSQGSLEKTKSDEKQDEKKLMKDLVIPTISITDESVTEPSKIVENKRENETLQNPRSTSSTKENHNKYSKLVLRKQNSMVHFSSESSSEKSLEKDIQPLHESMKDRDNIQRESQKYMDRAKSPSDGSQRGTERLDKPDSGTLPLLSNKFTIQRQNSKPNKISFQSTLTNYMKNETNMIKPILTNSHDGERPDRVKSAMMMANKKKLKFAKKKFHKSLDDVSHEQVVDAKKLTRIPNGRDVVTMVSLLSDESDVECDTPEPCSMMVHHPSTLAISPQPVEDSRGRQPVSTFQVCLRRPVDKPVALPVQTSASGRSYSTLYPSRRGPGFDASAPSSNSMASFNSSSSPLVSAAFKRKQTRVKSASLCSSSKSNSETDRISIDNLATTHSDTVDTSNEMPSVSLHNQDSVSLQPAASDVQEPSEMPNINLVINLTHPAGDEKENEEFANQNGTSDQLNQNQISAELNQNETCDQLNQTMHSTDGKVFGGDVDLDNPPIFSSSKERDCWAVYQKMTKKGVNVSYDTILRGMLTPTEYRLYRKCNAAALERADSLTDNIAVN